MAGDVQFNPGLGRSPREGIGYPLQPVFLGFPGGSDSKESAYNVGDLGLIPGLGRSSGGEHGNPLQYSRWRISMDRGTWRATVHEVVKSQT